MVVGWLAPSAMFGFSIMQLVVIVGLAIAAGYARDNGIVPV